ncbi:MAG TPA: hypothetical protein VF486_03215 [Actinomycetes bacterium]
MLGATSAAGVGGGQQPQPGAVGLVAELARGQDPGGQRRVGLLAVVDGREVGDRGVQPRQRHGQPT